MANIREYFGKFQFVYRRSRPSVKIVTIAALVFSVLAVVSVSWAKASVENRTENLRQEAIRLEHENQDLQNRIDIMGSVESVRQIAREELGLVDPDTVIIDLK